MTSKIGIRPSSVRESNIKLIMHLLYGSSCSRSDLAKSANLSNPALTKIIDQLLKIGFVSEGGEVVTNSRGRKKLNLVVNGNYASVIGIDFSSNDIQIVLANFAKKIVATKVLPDSAIITKEVLAKVISSIKELIAYSNTPVKAICVGVAGKVKAETNEVKKGTYKYPDSANMNFVSYFEEELGIKTILVNDASLQLLAEKKYSDNYPDTALIYNDYGMGGALWLNGKAFEGLSGFAAEFGAIPGAYQGECVVFEDICSINAMMKKCGYKLNDSRSFELFLEAYKGGGESETQAVDISANGMALLIRTLFGVTGCREVIITGKVYLFGKVYLEKVKAYLAEEKIFDMSALSIHYGKFCNNGTIRGTVEKAVEYIIDSESEKRNELI